MITVLEVVQKCFEARGLNVPEDVIKDLVMMMGVANITDIESVQAICFSITQEQINEWELMSTEVDK